MLWQILLVLIVGALRLDVATASDSSLPPFLVKAEERRQAMKNRLVLAEPVLELTPKNFKAETEDRSRTIVVVFMSSGCGWCKRITPALEKLATELEGTLCFGVVDHVVYAEIGLSLKVCVRTVPSLYIMKPSGASMLVTKYFGPRTPDDILGWISWHTGLELKELVFWKCIVFGTFHFAVSVLTNVLEELGIEPTDHGSGGGPLSDGGTIGYAGVLLGVFVASCGFLVLLMRMFGHCRCSCCRSTTPEKKQQ